MSKLYNINSFISGDMKAFESLYKAYVGKVFNYINSFIYDPDLAKDITQNTFLQLWEARSQLDPNGNIEGYIYSISRNLLFREIRRLNILRNYTDRIKEEIKEAEEPQIEENLSRDMIEQQILALLAELPEARRRIFLMRWSNGLSNKEIAQKLSISEKTVSTQIHRTIHFLKSKIGPIFIVFLIITSTKF
ncbi:RNA polymerase sigma factor [Bacteroides salyersiae]|uniref:RNA polymerase sigma factor n=1 Tax=Bacteroides salyersiae TaxID=291644 RepID=UPI001C8C64C3|nr:RNA polymerase sigma-70 factor [Bacteroides salyersiae]